VTRRRVIEPGKIWALSRRTTRHYFLLNPDEARQMEQSYWYCLGHAAEAHGVAVHAGSLMSTHAHEILTPEATIESLAYLIANPGGIFAVNLDGIFCYIVSSSESGRVQVPFLELREIFRRRQSWSLSLRT